VKIYNLAIADIESNKPDTKKPQKLSFCGFFNSWLLDKKE